ncbi:MAG: TatD family hydrolase [Verrucomicrobiaceae bacterium]
MLIDAHNHLQDPRFAGQQETLIKEMKAAGIAACVVNGTGEHDWPAVAQLAENHPGFIIPSFGLHPWKVGSHSPDWLSTLRDYLSRFPNAAVGECGLDRWIKNPDPAQREVFETQLELARDLNRPCTIHCLKAWGALLDTLHSLTSLPPFLLHSFGGSAEVAAQLTGLGAYFSISGYFLHDRKKAQLQIFNTIPPERILLETDAPDMLPPSRAISHPLPELNHPANLPSICREVAKSTKLPVDQCIENTKSFFALRGFQR